MTKWEEDNLELYEFLKSIGFTGELNRRSIMLNYNALGQYIIGYRSFLWESQSYFLIISREIIRLNKTKKESTEILVKFDEVVSRLTELGLQSLSEELMFNSHLLKLGG